MKKIVMLAACKRFSFFLHPSHILKRLDVWVLFLSLILFVTHLSLQQDSLVLLKPENLFSYRLQMQLGSDDEFDLKSFLPVQTRFQDIREETLQSSGLEYEENFSDIGRRVQWQGEEGQHFVRYEAQLAITPVHYEINRHLLIPDSYPESLDKYLQETPAIAVHHPEIKQLWASIKPEDTGYVLPVLQKIYQYTRDELETVAFKGLTDSLTALRLGMASCNGKSRLFVSLARLNNLPARLVGGVVLNNGKKRTSHQWVEVYLKGEWVPFDPTNGYFAEQPQNYLALYWGDFPLFSRTAGMQFDYQFSTSRQVLSPTLYNDTEYAQLFKVNIYELLSRLNIPAKMASLFLLFPVVTLLITFLRNVVGIRTFGVFMPMLVASACVFSGLSEGLLTLFAILLVAYSAHWVFDSIRLLKVPRLSAIITIITIAFLIFLYFSDANTRQDLGVLTFFPVVIISFMAEKLQQLSAEHNWREILVLGVGSLITILLCYLIFKSILLQGMFVLFPELLLAVLALQIYIGRWSGIRLSEILRFKQILDQGRVLGINSRNRDYVYSLNGKKELLLAADKLKTKQCLQQYKIKTPKTLAVFEHFHELGGLSEILDGLQEFVIKPNCGSQGNGILVIRAQKNSRFITAGGRELTQLQLQQHIKEIINGHFSQTGEADKAFIEPFIHQHPILQSIYASGLSDIRIIVKNQKVISAMLRIPTAESGGKANLHQGAVGVALDIHSGTTTRAIAGKKILAQHPDSGAELLHISLPFWDTMIDYALSCQRAVPLGYIGVDICIDEEVGPVVLEVNGRPGIEIQNIQGRGMHHALV